MEQIEKILSLTKKYVILTRKLINGPYVPGKDLDLQEQISTLDYELRQAIITYEDEQRLAQPLHKHTTVADELWNNKDKNNINMYEEKKPFTRLTFENSYGHKITHEWNSADLSVEDVLDGFYAALIGATWTPQGILHSMRDFAEERLEVLEPEEKEIENG